MKRQEKRRQEREKQDQLRYNEFLPKKIFDEDTGKNIDFLSSHCIYCNIPEPTMITLAEWSHSQRRLLCKVTGRDPETGEDDFDFYCLVCGIKNINTDYMKNFIQFWEKEKDKQKRFPDEYFASAIQRDMENHADMMATMRNGR